MRHTHLRWPTLRLRQVLTVFLSVFCAGVDVILDIVGGPYVNRNLEALGKDGRLFILGLQGGPKGEINLGPIIAKRLKITGT